MQLQEPTEKDNSLCLIVACADSEHVFGLGYNEDLSANTHNAQAARLVFNDVWHNTGPSVLLTLVVN
jgi:hypothetical protein